MTSFLSAREAARPYGGNRALHYFQSGNDLIAHALREVAKAMMQVFVHSMEIRVKKPGCNQTTAVDPGNAFLKCNGPHVDGSCDLSATPEKSRGADTLDFAPRNPEYKLKCNETSLTFYRCKRVPLASSATCAPEGSAARNSSTPQPSFWPISRAKLSFTLVPAWRTLCRVQGKAGGYALGASVSTHV